MGLQNMICVLGKYDIPIIQLQPDFRIDLLNSNIALFGSSMSGKTTFLRTLINILHKKYSEKQEQVFILDFGGALSDCKDLPLVSAYYDNSNEEYVKRVFKILENTLKNNIDELKGRNFKDAEVQPPHTTFIIDNINAFTDEPRYTAYNEKFAKLCRDGLSKGITVVFTAIDTKGLSSYMGNCRQKIAFEMPQDKYSEIFTGKVDMIGNNPGHGFANVTVQPEGITGTFRMNLPYEVQCALPYVVKNFKDRTRNENDHSNSEDDFWAKLKVKFDYSGDSFKRTAKKYFSFPQELTKAEYERIKQPRDKSELSEGITIDVGLDYIDFRPVSVNITKSPVIAIYGKREYGKTNLLNLLLDGIVKEEKDVRIVFFDDGRKQLEKKYDSIKKSVSSKYIRNYDVVELSFKDNNTIKKKLSPLQQFYVYLNENYISLGKNLLAGIYGISAGNLRQCDNIPDCNEQENPFTVFVIQSKLIYLNSNENKQFINVILPQMVAVAEDKRYCFIFSDVQKISDNEQNTFFNNTISTAFLLDNIAEFAGERGQKTVFGNMDVKSLKEDYARCSLGDGYYYDVEADDLKKLKFILNRKGD